MMKKNMMMGVATVALIASTGLSQTTFKSQFVVNLEAGKPQVIVTYGTSLTAGGAWVGQLTSALNEKFPGLATVVNSGMSGQWSHWGVRSIDANVVKKKPDAVFIEFSINDSVARFNCSVEQAKTNLETMVTAIIKGNPASEIILMTMTPGDKYPEGHFSHRKNIEQHYDMYRSVAKAHGFLLIDHYPNWKALQARDNAKFQQYVPDSIHSTAEGCAEIMMPTILDAIGIGTSNTAIK